MRLLLYLSVLSGVLTPIACRAQTYIGVTPAQHDSTLGEPGPVTPTLIKANGETIAAPAIENQIGFDSVQFSADHTRVAWSVLRKNDCCSIPIAFVVFKDDRIERVITEGTCLPKWAFRNGGSRIAYLAETCHFSWGPWFGLVDLASGKLVKRYSFRYSPDDDASFEFLPKDAPAWVHGLFGPAP